MRWFDSDFDYVQELIDTWNKKRKKSAQPILSLQQFWSWQES